MSEIEIGIIGGSGLYDMPGLSEVEDVQLSTPFGDPSDAIKVGILNGARVAFLPRHGRGHVLTPSEVPYQANIFALKAIGVRYIIAVSACGSLREDYEPSHIVIPDQLVDFTKGRREHTFFGSGLVAHVGVAQPFSPELSEVLAQAVEIAGGTVHRGGTFITIEGPRFSTGAESNLYRRWGMSIVGMTSSPEAYLAAEAEIAYSCMAHVTDYDVWHESEEPVTVEMVIKVLAANTSLAQKAIAHVAKTTEDWTANLAAHSGMRDAFLVGDWNEVPNEVRVKLAPLIGDHIA
ncbi:MAG: S-methyl-5'-thioadenosine phosphorylase [Chloroflexota bacterium]|nr:MAG: S-methyl-5'-thioadenosine phosphorylase [Chloroflexota bacterium]